MLKPAVVIVVLATVISFSVIGFAVASGHTAGSDARVIVVQDRDGGVLASVPLSGDTFAVSYRNSIYGTKAEERYVVAPDGSYRLEQIAADQLAVLEEYYGVPGIPVRTEPGDRRTWSVDPDPARPAVFSNLSIAATDLGERTLHVPGAEPLELWRLVDAFKPFITLDIKENP